MNTPVVPIYGKGWKEFSWDPGNIRLTYAILDTLFTINPIFDQLDCSPCLLNMLLRFKVKEASMASSEVTFQGGQGAGSEILAAVAPQDAEVVNCECLACTRHLTS